MFSLPVDKLLPQTQTPVGKTEAVSTWNLTVTIEPGIMENEQEWRPGSDHPHFHEHQIKTEIWFGDQCLFQTRLNQHRIVFSKNLPDTQIPSRQNLTIKFFGKPESPDLETNDHVVVKLDVMIENLPVAKIFEDQGYYQIDSTQEKKVAGNFLGENGQQVLEIYTPIYVWLLKNRNYFWQFSQNL